jgi:hypothetical protein
MISNFSNEKAIWDTGVAIIASFEALIIPVILAFSSFEEIYYLYTEFYAKVLYLIEFVYITDIVIAFRTTYPVKLTGIEVWDPVRIAKRYMMGGNFILDILSSLSLLASFYPV